MYFKNKLQVDLVLSSSEVLELAAKVLSKEEDLLRIPRGAVETLWCVCFFY
jgi:hypothetical protein